MKKLKKVMAVVLAVMMATAVGITVRGEYTDFEPISYEFDYEADAEFEQTWPNFGSVTGEVVSVSELTATQIRLAVGESTAYLNVNANTFVYGEFPQVGDTVTGFFNNNMPMILIYPPQYTAIVVVNQEEDLPFAFLDRFNAIDDEGMMKSADGQRIINAANPETVIVSQDGEDASDWDLEGRLLVVFYTVASRSLPPVIFAPEKIVVMYEIAVHPGPAYVGDMMGDLAGDDLWEWELPENNYTDEYDAPYNGDNGYIGIVPIWDEFHDIVVMGVGLPGETFHSIDGEHATHVPIRAIADAFGITVGWERPYVTLNGAWGNIRFRTNSNEVIVNGNTVILSHPNVVIDGRTQVPIDFFRLALGLNAWSGGGTVFIDNDEPME
ncbi:MAG: copper amine oxidase N-terminal domain-containing protein [Defluviitaleaceae bacterium]|nr:copper amine oxidase N-terminal domain-containing protein [Defluviitaleaceae bacterium]